MLSFKQWLDESTNLDKLSDKELMDLYKKLKKQGKNKEAEDLIDEIDKRGLKEETIIDEGADVSSMSDEELLLAKKQSANKSVASIFKAQLKEIDSELKKRNL